MRRETNDVLQDRVRTEHAGAPSGRPPVYNAAMWTRRLAGLGIGLLALSAALYALGIKLGAGIALVGAIWFLVEAFRFGYWQRHFLYTSRGVGYRPAPRYITAMISTWSRRTGRTAMRSVRASLRRIGRRLKRSRVNQP
jgi:hypothetical protein